MGRLVTARALKIHTTKDRSLAVAEVIRGEEDRVLREQERLLIEGLKKMKIAEAAARMNDGTEEEEEEEAGGYRRQRARRMLKHIGAVQDAVDELHADVRRLSSIPPSTDDVLTRRNVDTLHSYADRVAKLHNKLLFLKRKEASAKDLHEQAHTAIKDCRRDLKDAQRVWNAESKRREAARLSHKERYSSGASSLYSALHEPALTSLSRTSS